MAAITGSPSPLRRWRSPFVALAWGLSTLGLTASGGYLVYATALEVDRLTRLSAPKPPEVARDVLVRNARDLIGRKASFRILLFSDEFRWRLSSHAALENGSARFDFSPEMRAVLNDAREIICVGASSEEVARGIPFAQGRAREERRAARRAERIGFWVRQAVERPIPIRKLNVGHHAPTRRPARDTSDQRRVVIILVLDHDEDANIDQALRAAMARESVRAPIFETLLTRYSLAAGTAFTWVE